MSRMLKKSISALLSLIFIILLVTPQGVKAAESDPNAKLNKMVSDTVGFYQNNGRHVDSWWQLVALWGAGENLNDGKWILPSWEEKDPGLKANDSSTYHINLIFGLLAMNQDPSHAWETNRNLFAELAAQQDRSTGSFGGSNRQIWTMLALDTGEKRGLNVGNWNASAKEKALDFLLNLQLADGGFAFFGDESDIDITGMALLALGNYQSNSAAVAAIERAKTFLKQRQLDNGGFNSTGQWGSGDNSNSWATSVSGLVAVGEDVLSNDWVVNDHSVVDAAYNFQRPNGSFNWKVTDIKENLMATEQVLIALTDIQNEESVWQRFANTANTTTIQLNVNGINAPIYPQQSVTTAIYGRQATAMDALKQALVKVGIKPIITNNITYGAYFSGVTGQLSASFGGYDGWMFSVNGLPPNVGAASYIIQPNDIVSFYYSRWPSIAAASQVFSNTTNPSLRVKLVGDTFTTEALLKSNWSLTAGTTELTIDRVAPINNQEVMVTFWGGTKEGSLKIKALPAALVSESESNELNVTVNRNMSSTVDQQIVIGPDDTNLSFSTVSNDPVTNKVTITFSQAGLPELFAKRGNTELDIPANTVVTSTWDKELQLPTNLSTSDGTLTIKINGVLSSSGRTLNSVDSRIKVGGDSRIQFNQHVTLKLKGMGDRDAGFIDGNGAFTVIPKYTNGDVRSDDAYAYSENGDLIIKTKHFTEFLAYKSTLVNAGPGPGPIGNTQTVTLSIEKRSLGEGDIVTPIAVTLESGDTAFTLLKRVLDARNIPIEFNGAGASIYVKSIDNLKEMDRDLPLSGWMYSVNGIFPKYSAGIYTLHNNDVLRWQFTKDLGEDVGNPYEPPGSGTGTGVVPGKPTIPTETSQSNLAAKYEDASTISDWAQDSVTKVTYLGFMEGTGKQFEPKREITRAEFAALILRYTGDTLVSSTSDFEDVSSNDWFAKYVATAKAKGLIAGTSATTFVPNQAITRQEMAVILVRLKGLSTQEQKAVGLQDQADVSAWALPYVSQAYASGLMTGDSGYFRPLLPVTREMAAVVIARLYEQK